MRQKGHEAVVEFRHGGQKGHASLRDTLETDQGEIHVSVITDALSRGLKGLDPRKEGLGVQALSGGEKSSTNVILLAAVSDVADPPFRIVDEFDVYQDETSRKASIKALVDDALTPNTDGTLRQHILLTPLDVSSAVKITDPNIRVFKMPDPKRRTGGRGAGAGAGAGADDA
jgi:hypothetical protein